MSRSKPDYNQEVRKTLDKINELDRMLEVSATAIGIKSSSTLYGEFITDSRVVEKVRDVLKEHRVELAKEVKELMKKAIEDE